jgi:preprotein translocase subunit SecB
MAKDKKPEDAAAPGEATPAKPAADQQQASQQPGMRVAAQYIKDLSFENPKAPASLRGDAQAPKMELQVEMNARNQQDGLFEVELKLTATAKRESEVAFHVELVYGGLFAVSGIKQEELEPILLIECPRYLFPFARRVIADLTTEGGFPPFRIDPIDFAGIYMARRAEIERQQGGAAGGGQTAAPPPSENA